MLLLLMFVVSVIIAVNGYTGVCKTNGVVIVVNGCCSIGFSTTISNTNIVFCLLQTPVLLFVYFLL